MSGGRGGGYRNLRRGRGGGIGSLRGTSGDLVQGSSHFIVFKVFMHSSISIIIMGERDGCRTKGRIGGEESRMEAERGKGGEEEMG